MLTRTIAASVLALGLVAPVVATQAFAAERNYACAENQRDNLGDVNCLFGATGNANVESSAGLVAPSTKVVKKTDIGQFIDETREESNQRSSTR